MQYALRWIRQRYDLVVKSIAFYPAVIAIGFLILSYIMLRIDFSDFGKHIKSNISWVSLRDASTARTISSTIAASILSLAVFSFSMVMILLNQAASTMSNRLLNSLIGNSFQQTVLGFYIGTIVYALFLLSTIRDIDSGIYVPALSIYLLILLTVVDIFLFIYFLHYITQSVKYETIIHRIYVETSSSLKHSCTLICEGTEEAPGTHGITIGSTETGYYQGIARSELVKFCQEKNCTIEMLHPAGTYVLHGSPLFAVYGLQHISSDFTAHAMTFIDIYNGQSISQHPWYGFEQLTEVAIKALSPGINDPGTALLSVHALAGLMAMRMKRFPEIAYKDDSGAVRVTVKERTFKEIFDSCIHPIWDYGKKDRKLMTGMKEILQQLQQQHPEPPYQLIIGDMLQRTEAALATIVTAGPG